MNFTPCDCDPLSPSWHITSSHGYIVVGDHAFLLFPIIYVGPVPVLAFPILDLPLQDRRTGLLIPRPSYDPRRGFALELPVFFTFGSSYDLTLTPGYFFGSTDAKGVPIISRSVQGPRLVSEFRYAPQKNITGSIRLGLLDDLLLKRDPAFADCLTNPSVPGCETMPKGRRGIRAEAAFQHYGDMGSHFYTKADVSLVSDGYYLGDVATDLFTTGTPYLRSTAAAYRRDDSTYVGLDVVYRQDLRYGFQLIGPVDRNSAGQALYGPNTLQRLPALTVSIPDTPIWGKLMGGFRAEVERTAPLTLLTGDEGADGVFTCTQQQGAKGCDDGHGQSNRRYDPGEREARLRMDLRPRLAYPLVFANFLHVTPSVWYRQDIYLGEATNTYRQRGYGEGSLEVEAELERSFGEGPNALHHALMPVAQVRYVPRVFGSTLGSYDEIDSAVPQPTRPGLASLAQGSVEIRQRLYQHGREWLKLDVGQGFDMLNPRVADTFGRVVLNLGPIKGSTIARYDPVRGVISQVAAQARYSRKDGEVYVQYDSYAVNGSDQLRRPLDGLVGPAVSGAATAAQQIVAGIRYQFRFGVGLSYEAVVVPPATPMTLQLAQQRIGVTLAPACGCWSLEGGVRLIPTAAGPLQFNFEANLTIAHFGSIGTGG